MVQRCIFIGTGILALAFWAHGACVGPDALESKLRAQRDTATLTELGTWFDRHQQYGCAIGSYRSALKLNPSLPLVWELLGESLSSAGDLSASAQAFRESIRLFSRNPSPHLGLAAVLEQLEQKEEAKAQWQEALRLNPQSRPGLDGLSRHLIAQGDYSGAIALLREVKLDEMLTLDLAQAYGKAGLLQDAEDLLTQAVKEAPSSYPLVNALATVYVNEGHRQKALETVNKFATAHPDNAEAQMLQLRLLLLTNDTSQAALLAHKQVALHPRDPYLLYICGTLERQAGEYPSARDHLQLAVTLDPNVYQSHYGLGMVLLKLGDLPGAKEQFDKALALGATDPEIHLELGMVLRKLGDVEAAERELRRYREVSQSISNASVAESKAILAQQALDSDDSRKAAALYREALQASPGDALLHYKLSVALENLGDVAAERDALEKAVQIDPDMAAAHNQLGYLASRSGDAASAEECFKKAVRSAPAFVEAWINLAATLGMEFKLTEAQEAVERALRLAPNNVQALQLRQDLVGVSQSPVALGLGFYKKGDYTSARQQFETAYKKAPNEVRTAILLADANLHLNAPADAIAVLQPLAAANAENLDFEFVYGTALIASGHRREGLPHIEKVARSKQSADAYMMAGEALLSLDEYERASEDLETSLRLDPNLPRIKTLVGMARDKLGDTKNAEAAFRDALKTNPEDFQANLYLGAILYQRRELDESKPYLDRALKLNPDDPMARYQNAMLKSASGEHDVARSELEELEKSNPDWLEPHVALATLYYKVHRPEDGAREREIVERLTAQKQAEGTKSK